MYVLSKVGKQYKTFKAGEDGKPTGDALGTFNSRLEAENSLVPLFAVEGKVLTATELKAIKCYGASEYTYVPWGVSTLADALAAQEAQDDAQEIQSLGSMYKQIVDNILGNSDLKDKAKAITALADEFATQLTDTASGDSEKAVDNTTSNSGDKESNKVPDHMLIKSLGNDRIGSYAVLWGTETKKDLTGEYFDESTEELTAIFDVVKRLPYIYQHTLDDTIKTRVTGIVDTLRPDSIGLWYEAQLLMADEYDAQIKKLILEQKLKTSSQTFPAARRVSKSGHIERWPIVEISATPTPAEFRMPPVEFLKSAYATYGVDYEEIIKRYEPETDKTQGAVKARALLNLQRQRLLIGV
jgi:hypothetical protein